MRQMRLYIPSGSTFVKGQETEMYILLLFAGLASATSLTSLACRNNCLRTSEDVCGTTPCINGCNPGWYGAHCSKRCSSECGSSTCHQYNGSCSDDNYLRSILKLNKRQSGSKKTSKRSLKNCLVSDKFHENKCKCCVSNYRGDNCNTFCEECRTIQTESVCEYLCPSGYYGETCDNTCPETCKIGSYGRPVCKSVDRGFECSYGCTAGYYGDSCDRMCSDSCLNKACHQLQGRCLNCPDGYYGNDCTYPCNMKCVNERCYRNGTCIYGCKNDRFCNKTCPVNCQETNSTNSACDENSLVCLYGCKHGFFGDQCDKPCVTSCIECEKETGDCLRCKDSWLGGKCDQKCVDNCEEGCYHNGTCRKCSPGYYGNSCIKDRKVNRNSKSTQGTAPEQIIVPCIIGLAVIVIASIIFFLVLRLKFKKARCLDRFLCGRCLKEGEAFENHPDREEIEPLDAGYKIKDNPFKKADDERKAIATHLGGKGIEPPDAVTTEEKRQREPLLPDEARKQRRPQTKGYKIKDNPFKKADDEKKRLHLDGEKIEPLDAEVPEIEGKKHDNEGEKTQLPDAEEPVNEDPHPSGSADRKDIQPTDTEVPENIDPHPSGSADGMEIQPIDTEEPVNIDPHPSGSADGMEIQPTDTDYKIGDNPFKKANDEKKRLARGKNKN